jgi:hypothetical protein
MTSLQALLFIIQFQQATGNLKGCYNLLGVALRSALRMGLHRYLPHLHISSIESETRKRVFHTIRQMDIYVSTTLGLPVVLRAVDIDQPLPIAIDDELIVDGLPLQPSAGRPCIIQAFNAHASLMEILAVVVEHVYPPRAASKRHAYTSYLIDCNRIREVEKRLQDWLRQLPATWRPGHEDEDVQLMR